MKENWLARMKSRLLRSVQFKIGALLFLVVVVSSVITTWNGMRSTASALTEGAESGLANAVASEAARIEASLSGVLADLEFLVEVPATRGVLRALGNWNVDPITGSTTAQWTEQGEVIVSSLMASKPIYMRIRLIGRDGRELVRVDRGLDGALSVPGSDARQSREKNDYFKETMQLVKGGVYISRLELTREHGKVVQPHRPVMRYAIPVYGQDGDGEEDLPRGIFIVDVEARVFLAALKNQSQRSNPPHDVAQPER